MLDLAALLTGFVILLLEAGFIRRLRRERDALRTDLVLAKQQHEHMGESLQLRAKQLARKEDELEAVEAQLLEAKAEIVLLRGDGPEAA